MGEAIEGGGRFNHKEKIKIGMEGGNKNFLECTAGSLEPKWHYEEYILKTNMGDRTQADPQWFRA